MLVLLASFGWGEDQASSPLVYDRQGRIHLADHRILFYWKPIHKPGPARIEEVQVYWTRDGGRRWELYRTYPAGQSRLEMAFPRDGVYGVSVIAVDEAGGSEPIPQVGDSPEKVFVIDTVPPDIRLVVPQPAYLIPGASVLLQWEAVDAVGEVSVSLEYAGGPERSWKRLAESLSSHGKQSWTVPDPSGEVSLRAVAIDQAGNQGISDPVGLSLPPSFVLEGPEEIDGEQATLHLRVEEGNWQGGEVRLWIRSEEETAWADSGKTFTTTQRNLTVDLPQAGVYGFAVTLPGLSHPPSGDLESQSKKGIAHWQLSRKEPVGIVPPEPVPEPVVAQAPLPPEPPVPIAPSAPHPEPPPVQPVEPPEQVEPAAIPPPPRPVPVPMPRQPPPEEAKRHFMLAHVNWAKRDHAGVERELKAALEIFPSYAEALNDLGCLYFELAQYPKAVEHFRMAARLVPEDADYHYNIGYALLATEQPILAIHSLRRALELRPDHLDAIWHLAETYRQRGRYAPAVELWQRFVDRADPNHPGVTAAKQWIAQYSRQAKDASF
jgi:hypothetical protein